MTSLSEFFDDNRPVVMDLYNIILAVMSMLVNSDAPNNIIFHIEYIYYDRRSGKLKFTNCKEFNADALKQVNALMMQIHIAIEYAGKDTNTFLNVFSQAFASDRGVSECMELLDKYENELCSLNKRFSSTNILFVLTVILMEVLLFLISEIKFYV